MSDLIDWIGIVAVSVGPLWLIFHYVTKWKQSAKITPQDENLLDEMYTLARRLEDRVMTVERIVAADNPDFRAGLTAQNRDWQDQRAPYQIDRRN
ncbi:envelope stress response membrane protein PspB [Sphingomonas bacterium]|uniref:envelope stress response membrane protein PspB n=1 Tax=Sphingomonas bacterium TaxID=1895847 RepID=UPI001576CBCA|nr:envelope stress response membrane protein PspB [Sphingomonas bacterium]